MISKAIGAALALAEGGHRLHGNTAQKLIEKSLVEASAMKDGSGRPVRYYLTTLGQEMLRLHRERLASPKHAEYSQRSRESWAKKRARDAKAKK